jgi:hypothetical protein
MCWSGFQTEAFDAQLIDDSREAWLGRTSLEATDAQVRRFLTSPDGACSRAEGKAVAQSPTRRWWYRFGA